MEKVMSKFGAFMLSLLVVISCINYFPTGKVYATQSRSSNFSKSYSLTGDIANDIVAVAKAQLGKTGSDLGYSEEWCADFATDCARLTGVSTSIIPYNYESRGACRYLYSYMINNCNAKVVSTPKKGDFIFFDWDGTKSESNLHHVAIVTGYSNGTISTIGGNQGNGSSWSSRVVSNASYSINNSDVAKIVRPNYTTVQPTFTASETAITLDASKGDSKTVRFTARNYDIGGFDDSNNINIVNWKCTEGFHITPEKDNVIKLREISRNSSNKFKIIEYMC